MNMNLEDIVKELCKLWTGREQNRNILGGIEQQRQGVEAEDYALKELKKQHKDYKFCKTPQSKTPADIVGLKQTQKYWHFCLYQCKSSTNKRKLNPNKIVEKQTLPELSKVLQRMNPTKKGILITTGYIGIHVKNGKYEIQIMSPYRYRTKNKLKLILNSSEITELKNNLHKDSSLR